MSAVQTVKCGQCRFEFEHGAHICQGCTGRIVYGATTNEIAEAMKIGAFLFAILGAILTYGLPALLNSQLHTTLPGGWGLGPGGLLVIAFFALGGALWFRSMKIAEMRGVVRTFK